MVAQAVRTFRKLSDQIGLAKQQPRGAWQYSGEIDLGFGAALRTAAVIVAQDPIFGRIAYGGALSHSGNKTEVIPQDGVGRRFHLLDAHHRLHLELDQDGFAEDKPIQFDDDLQRINFVIKNRDPLSPKPHSTQLTIVGLPGTYEITANGKSVGRLTAGNGIIVLPIGENSASISLVRTH